MSSLSPTPRFYVAEAVRGALPDTFLDVETVLKSACESMSREQLDFLGSTWYPRVGQVLLITPSMQEIAASLTRALSSPGDGPLLSIAGRFLRCMPAGESTNALAAAITETVRLRLPATLPPDASQMLDPDLELTRELASCLVASKTVYSDGSWLTNEMVPVRTRAAAFIGTIEGTTCGPAAAERRLASDLFAISSVLCGCEKTELVLTTIAAVSSCLAMARTPACAAAAAAMAWATVNRHCWGAFGKDTADFTRDGALDVRKEDAASISGEASDEEEEEKKQRLLRRRLPEYDQTQRGRVSDRWTRLVNAVLRRSLALARDAVRLSPAAALIAAAMACQGMEATVDFAERMRYGCDRDESMALRFSAMRDGVARLAEASVEQLARGGGGGGGGGGGYADDEIWRETRRIAAAVTADPSLTALGSQRPAWTFFVACCLPATRELFSSVCRDPSEAFAAIAVLPSYQEAVWRALLGRPDLTESGKMAAVAIAIDAGLWAAVMSDDRAATRAAVSCSSVAIGEGLGRDMFVAGLLGGGAVSDPKVADWLDGMCSRSRGQRLLERVHGGVASAGWSAALEIVRHMPSCGSAVAWVLRQTGWEAFAETLQIEKELISDLARQIAEDEARLTAGGAEKQQDGSGSGILADLKSIFVSVKTATTSRLEGVMVGGGGGGGGDDIESGGKKTETTQSDRASLVIQRLTAASWPPHFQQEPTNTKKTDEKKFLIEFCAAVAERGAPVVFPEETDGLSLVAMKVSLAVLREWVTSESILGFVVAPPTPPPPFSRLCAARTIVAAGARLIAHKSDESATPWIRRAGFYSGDAPLGFSSEREAAFFATCADRLLASHKLCAADVSSLCFCLATAMNPMSSPDNADLVHNAIAKADDDEEEGAALACSAFVAAARVGICGLWCAALRGGCDRLAKTVEDLKAVVGRALKFEKWGSARKDVARMIADACAVMCTVMGIATETATYVIHARRTAGDAAALSSPPSDAGASATISAIRDCVAPELIGIASLKLVGENVTPEKAMDSAIRACQMWFPPSRTPLPFRQSTRVREDLRTKYKIDAVTRNALADLSIAMLGDVRADALRAALVTLKNNNK